MVRNSAFVVKPDYYDRFCCIGGSCSFTCCQEWKIAVDEETNAKWKKMAAPAGLATRRKNLSLFTTFKDGGRVIALEKNHKCPFLREDLLCRLVCEYGEENISNTCHIFPREIHVVGDHVEYTLMPCCPEVIDLLDQTKRFTLICEDKEKADWTMQSFLTGKKDAESLRALFMDILQREAESPEILLAAVFYLMSSIYEEGSYVLNLSENLLEEILETLAVRQVNFSDELAESNELFLDLIDNYRKEGMYREWLDDAAGLAEEMEEEDDCEEYLQFRKCWQKYHPLMKKLLAQEMYADLLIWENEDAFSEEVDEETMGEEMMEHMMIHLQWTAMEYVMIRHLAFLTWYKQKDISYEEVRSFIVLTGRIMGYEDEDIYEYLENSFESLIWEWGYLALILGK